MLRMLCQHATARAKKLQHHAVILFGTYPMSTSPNVGLSFQQSTFLDGVTFWGRSHCLQNLSIISKRMPQNYLVNNTPSFMMYHSSTIRIFGLEEFRDTIPRQQREIEPVGRSWSAVELRRKSYDDLHKLWYILYKERNMLLTEQQLSRRKGLNFPQSDRILKVRKSMGAIKHVLGERKREHLIQVKAAREKKLTNDDNDEPLPQSA